MSISTSRRIRRQRLLRKSRRSLRPELLESRMMLATSVGLDGFSNLLIDDVTDDPNDLTIVLTDNGTNFRVSDNLAVLVASSGAIQDGADVVIPVANVVGDSVRVNTHGGDDNLKLDFAGGGFGKVVAFAGGAQSSSTNGDTLELVDSSVVPTPFNDLVFDYDNASDGSINLDGQVIDYSGLEPISSLVPVANTTLNFSDEGETIAIGSSGATRTNINSTDGESTTFVNPTNSLTVNTGAGVDLVNINSLAENYPASLSVDGEAGIDGVNILDAVTLATNRSFSIIGDVVDVDGTVTVAGTGALSISAARLIELNPSSSLTVADGDLTLSANRGASVTTGNFVGIEIDTAIVQTTGTGNIVIDGRGGDDENSSLHNGVHIIDQSTVRSTSSGANAGTITITGQGGVGVRANEGVTIEDGSRVTSVDGHIVINGTGGVGTDSGNVGVFLVRDGGVLSTGTGSEAASITVTGSGGNGGTSSLFGFALFGEDSRISSVDGDIDITGNGGDGTSFFNAGTVVFDGARIESTGTGSAAAAITIHGNGGDASVNSHGVTIHDNSAAVVSVDGNILIEGTGGDGLNAFSTGVRVARSGLIQSTGTGSGAARITINGQGGAGSGNLFGSYVATDDAKITSIDGDIVVTGTGGNGTDNFNGGVALFAGGIIESTGDTAFAANIDITGHGGNGVNFNHGTTNEGVIRVVEGDIDLDGFGGNGEQSTFTTGVFAGDLQASGAGNITVTGVGGIDSVGLQQYGINVAVDALIEINTGDLLLLGTGGTNSGIGVRFSDTIGRIVPTGNGTITVAGDSTGGRPGIASFSSDNLIGGPTFDGLINLVADSIEFDLGTVQSSGALNIIPFHDNQSIGIGGGLGTLNLSDAEIANFADGFSGISIGKPGAGNVELDTAVFRDPVTFIGNTVRDGSGTDLIAPAVNFQAAVSPGQSPGILIAAADILLDDDKSLTIEINGNSVGEANDNYDQVLVNGRFDIGSNVTLSTLTLNGFTPSYGERFIIVSRVGGAGVFANLPEDASVTNFLNSGKDAKITYAGGDGDDIEIRLAGFSLTQTGSGTLVDETETTDSFDVVLDTPPASDVVFQISNNDTGEVIASASSLTFTPADWNVPQTVTVTGVDDALLDGDQITAITVIVDDANSDDDFDILDNALVAVRTVDDESPDAISPTLGSVELNTNQSDPADLLKGPQPVSWSEQRSDILSIELTFSEPMDVQPADFVLTNLGVNAPVDADSVVGLSAANIEINNEVVVLRFASDELLDGVYELEVLPTAADRRGNLLDGDGNGIGGDGFEYRATTINRFYQLSADWNGDAGVSVFDFTTFSYWFGVEVPQAPSYADVNNDGGVSVFDFTPFSENFGVGIVYETSFASTLVPSNNVDQGLPTAAEFGEEQFARVTMEVDSHWLGRHTEDNSPGNDPEFNLDLEEIEERLLEELALNLLR